LSTRERDGKWFLSRGGCVKGDGWQMVFKQRWSWTTRERDGRWFLNRGGRGQQGRGMENGF